MDWQTASSLGAVGGALVETISLYGNVTDWQAARRDALRHGRQPLPRLRDFVDLPADTLVAATRLALGAVAGWLFHAQLVGSEAAIAVGASAPAVLRQLSNARTIRDVLEGAPPPAAGARRRTGAAQQSHSPKPDSGQGTGAYQRSDDFAEPREKAE